MHAHNRLMALCLGLRGWAGTSRNIHPIMREHQRRDTCHLLGFMVQGKITEADTLPIRLDATPSGISVPPPPSSRPFLCRMLFLLQSAQFILVWNRQQAFRVAYFLSVLLAIFAATTTTTVLLWDVVWLVHFSLLELLVAGPREWESIFTWLKSFHFRMHAIHLSW